MFRTYDHWKTTEPESGYDPPVEPSEEDLAGDAGDARQQRIPVDPTLPVPGWFDPALRPDLVQTEAVDMIKYIGSGKLTMGTYASAQMAMLASDEVGPWIKQDDGSFRSQDGRSLIAKVKV